MRYISEFRASCILVSGIGGVVAVAALRDDWSRLQWGIPLLSALVVMWALAPYVSIHARGNTRPPSAQLGDDA